MPSETHILMHWKARALRAESNVRLLLGAARDVSVTADRLALMMARVEREQSEAVVLENPQR